MSIKKYLSLVVVLATVAGSFVVRADEGKTPPTGTPPKSGDVKPPEPAKPEHPEVPANVSPEVKALIDQFKAAREKYLADQSALREKLKGATEAQRQTIRDQLKTNREAFNEQNKALREQIRERVKEVRAQLPGHQKPVDAAGGSNGGRPGTK